MNKQKPIKAVKLSSYARMKEDRDDLLGQVDYWRRAHEKVLIRAEKAEARVKELQALNPDGFELVGLLKEPPFEIRDVAPKPIKINIGPERYLPVIMNPYDEDVIKHTATPYPSHLLSPPSRVWLWLGIPCVIFVAAWVFMLAKLGRMW